MSELNLKDLMRQELDPKQVELRAKYHNAQIAVDMAYRYAGKLYSIPEIKTLNPDYEEGKSERYDKYIYTSPTTEQNAQELVKGARLLKIEIEKDLNDTLKVLEGDKEDGSQAAAPQLS